MNPQSTITVKTFATEIAAEAAASYLEAHGIHSLLTADDCGGMLSTLDNFAGVKLTVATADADAARDLLNRAAVLQSEPETEDTTQRTA